MHTCCACVPISGKQLRKQHYTEHERDDKRPRAVIHKQEVAHLQIGMVAEQGRELRERRGSGVLL